MFPTAISWILLTLTLMSAFSGKLLSFYMKDSKTSINSLQELINEKSISKVFIITRSNTEKWSQLAKKGYYNNTPNGDLIESIVNKKNYIKKLGRNVLLNSIQH